MSEITTITTINLASFVTAVGMFPLRNLGFTLEIALNFSKILRLFRTKEFAKRNGNQITVSHQRNFVDNNITL